MKLIKIINIIIFIFLNKFITIFILNFYIIVKQLDNKEFILINPYY